MDFLRALRAFLRGLLCSSIVNCECSVFRERKQATWRYSAQVNIGGGIVANQSSLSAASTATKTSNNFVQALQSFRPHDRFNDPNLLYWCNYRTVWYRKSGDSFAETTRVRSTAWHCCVLAFRLVLANFSMVSDPLWSSLIMQYWHLLCVHLQTGLSKAETEGKSFCLNMWLISTPSTQIDVLLELLKCKWIKFFRPFLTN